MGRRLRLPIGLPQEQVAEIIFTDETRNRGRCDSVFPPGEPEAVLEPLVEPIDAELLSYLPRTST
jgi:hypothetical protein